MASSIRKSQEALVCQLCAHELKIKWKCVECGLLMCQRCRDTVHPSAQNHTVIDIREVSKHQRDSGKKLDFSKITCRKHVDQTCCLFCQHCYEPVCPVCIITKSHVQHDFVEIKTAYQIKVVSLETNLKSLGREMQMLTKEGEDIQKIKTEKQVKFDALKKEILDREKEIIGHVKSHTNKLLSNLDQERIKASELIKTRTKYVNNNMKVLLKQNKEFLDLLQSGDVEKIFSTKPTKATESIFRGIIADNIYTVEPKFVPGDLSKMSLLYGALNSESRNIRMIQRFRTDYSEINDIVVCNDGSLWIGIDDANEVQKVVLTDCRLPSIRIKIKTNCLGMSLTPSGNLLLSVPDASELKVVPYDTNKMKKSSYSASPLVTLAVHVTAQNEVLVGAIATGNWFPPSGSQRVVLMSSSGRHEKTFQYDPNGQLLFSLPVRLASNSTNTFGVIDILSNDLNGRVLIMDMKGSLLKVYTGHPQTESDRTKFMPHDIASSKCDHFMIADSCNHTIHMLDKEGNFITFYNTLHIGIKSPLSLSVNRTGQLYIGGQSNDDSSEMASVFVTDNFE